jgi:hypothetical protein
VRIPTTSAGAPLEGDFDGTGGGDLGGGDVHDALWIDADKLDRLARGALDGDG